MTKEKFYKLAVTPNVFDKESIFRLVLYHLPGDEKGYVKVEGRNEWEYHLYETDYLFTSREKAEKALTHFIKDNEIHSAIIFQELINVSIGDGGWLAWWMYDNLGEMISNSVCTGFLKDTYGGELLEKENVYFGREPEKIRFKLGDIVEVFYEDKAFLAVLNGVPATIEEMWELYERNKKIDGCLEVYEFENDYFGDVFSDAYFYIEENGFDRDVAPYMVSKPFFPVPEDEEKIWKARFHRWKANVGKYVSVENYPQ